jgi:hypothetical protein
LHATSVSITKLQKVSVPMEQAVYKELKEICEKIINASTELPPADYLAEVRELEEKLILLNYLHHRRHSLSRKTWPATGHLDEELLETLKQAKAQQSDTLTQTMGGKQDAENILPAKEQIAQTPPINLTSPGESKDSKLVHESEDILPAKEQFTQTPPIHLKDERDDEHEKLIHEPEDILPAKELTPQPEATDEPKSSRPSINESFAGGHIKLGLNDRLAFTSHLFAGSQEDLNRVVSQLNTFNTYREAIQFIEDIVKPDYDWSKESDYEERLMDLIKAKFGEA